MPRNSRALRYPLPPGVLLPLAASVLRRRERDFRRDARACVARLDPPLQISGREHLPARGPCLLVINHYSSPSFRAWWLTLAVSAQIPAPLHWVITAAWTSPRPLYAGTVTPLSRWLFRRVAAVYGFTTMPPMPPDPADAVERAAAVRRVLAYARGHPDAWIGLAPEGADSPGGGLHPPPPGAGRFIHHLAKIGLTIVPTGIYEDNGRLCLSFGPAFRLELPGQLSHAELDQQVSRIVQEKIARLLPERLQGQMSRPKL